MDEISLFDMKLDALKEKFEKDLEGLKHRLLGEITAKLSAKMADTDLNEDLQKEKTPKKSAKHDSGAADLEKVTDYAEEKEIFSNDIANAMSDIGREVAEKMAAERELLKVNIRRDDVEVIMRELEVSRTKAERTLRENQGNVVEALIALTN